MASRLRRALLGLGHGFGLLMCRCLQEKRQTAVANLVRAYPHLTPSARMRLVRSSFVQTGVGLAEALWTWSFGNAGVCSYTIEGREHVDLAKRAGRGVLLVQAQSTCLDVAIAPIREHWPVHVVAAACTNEGVSEYVQRQRSALVDGMYNNNDMRSVVRGLQRGELIWMCPDVRIPVEQGGGAVRMLGRKTTISRSPVRLAKMTGAAVVPFMPRRVCGGSQYQLVFYPALSLAGDPAQNTQELAEALERQVREQASQYPWHVFLRSNKQSRQVHTESL